MVDSEVKTEKQRRDREERMLRRVALARVIEGAGEPGERGFQETTRVRSVWAEPRRGRQSLQTRRLIVHPSAG